jgi:hypothetical protein
MNSTSSNQKFKKVLFWMATLFLALHILLAIQSIFFKIDFLPGRINSFYKKLIVLGPFFSDTRIQTSPHLFVRYPTSSGEWSPFHEAGLANFRDFKNHPWRYDQLKWSDYERYVSRKAYTEIRALKYIDGSEGMASAELIQYVRKLPSSEPDSVMLTYIWNTWQPETRSVKTDTAFAVMFKPTKGEATQ